MLDRYRAEGLSVYVVPDRDKANNESFQHWVDRVGDVLAEGHDVVFQMPFVHEGIRGIADFLRRVDDPDTGTFTYEPIDAKLARKEAKPGHVLQLCFYAEAIEAATGVLPEHMHIELGSGRTETIRTADVLAYWRRLRGQLAKLLSDDAPTDTVAEPCTHCDFCDFEQVCEADWRAADSLVHVAGVRAADRVTLTNDGVATIAALAELDREVVDLDEARRDTFVRQARLQVQARNAPDAKPPFELLEAPSHTDHAALDDDADAPDPIGFAALPAPDDGDVFLDFEGHPFWHADAELFFLFGLIERSPARRVGVQGVLGARQGRGSRRHEGADRSPRRPPGAVPGHARVPLQPHRAVVARAAGHRARRRRTRARTDDHHRAVRRPVADREGGDAGRRRGLRPQAHRAAHRLRARPRDRQGLGRRRRVRAVDGVEGPGRRRGRARPDRRLQRGRRARHPGAARLAGDATSRRHRRGGRR